VSGGAGGVRPAVAADAAELGRIQVASWRAAYAGLIPDRVLAGLSAEGYRAQWEPRLPATPPVGCFVAGAPPLGFVTCGPPPDAGDDAGAGGRDGEVYAIYVEPAHWRAGHGRALLAAAVGHLRGVGFTRAGLWVLTTNAPARGFYEHEGWTATGATQVDVLHGVELHETRYALPLR
jgi:GNAT superfamily N-acetyltransferase